MSNLKTEDEARDAPCIGNIHCGIARENGPLGNRVYCMGSDCKMAWRWSRAKETKGYLEAVQERMKETGEDFKKASSKVFESAELFEETEGYCGLAGGDQQ